MSKPSDKILSGHGITAPHRFEQFIEKQHRVFVNRNLKMSSIRWVGFDMDHTLALYNGNFIEALAFDLAKEALVREKGYPEQLLEIRYDPQFGIRGLVVDKEQGNILKMDKFHYVSEAYHGKRSLDKETRKALYTSGALQLSSSRFWSSDTLFGLPEIALYASVVGDLERSGWPEDLDHHRLFDDIRFSVDLVHKDGTLKSVILKRLSECFLRDPKLVHTLEKFRREGMHLFLLTNSSYEYSDQVLTHVLADAFLGKRWWEYFDLIVTDSGKPDFFLKAPRWKAAQNLGHSVPTFSGGNYRLLERQIGARGDSILYIGDHIFGDILRSKKSSGWRTVMIVEELDHEVRANLASEGSREKLDRLQMRNGEILDELHAVRTDLDALRAEKLRGYKSLAREQLRELDEKIASITRVERRLDEELTRNLLRSREIEDEIKLLFNPYWGSLCKVEGELSRFGDQMNDFACLYTSRVSNFLNYPPNKYFLSPEEYLPHEI